MKQSQSFCAFLCMVIASASLCAQDYDILLCSDSGKTAPQRTKLVYTYIDGKKTACMSEADVRQRIAQHRFTADTLGKTGAMIEAKKAEAKKKVTPSPLKPIDSLVIAIRSGKKDLENADLMNADLSGADMRGADLRSADLRGANLANARLDSANLEAAYLRRARAAGANFSSANIRNVYFTGTDLAGASGLTRDALKSAHNFHKALLDAEVLAVIKAECPEKLKDPEKCWENNRWSDNDDCSPEKALQAPKDK